MGKVQVSISCSYPVLWSLVSSVIVFFGKSSLRIGSGGRGRKKREETSVEEEVIPCTPSTRGWREGSSGFPRGTGEVSDSCSCPNKYAPYLQKIKVHQKMCLPGCHIDEGDELIFSVWCISSNNPCAAPPSWNNARGGAFAVNTKARLFADILRIEIYI